MFNKTPLVSVGSLVAVTFAALLTAPVPAFAEEQAIEEVIVTGSRIRRTDLEGSSPVQIFDRADIVGSGDTSLGDILREIPSVAGAAQTTQINNGGGGAKTVSLRGLGSSRTLVLMNGRRLPNSTLSLTGNVDLNTIPVSMVERVEVLKDGASAVYGSDAVSGVVNVITRRDFDGIELNIGKGETTANDGETEELSLTFGKAYDGGHFMFDASYTEEGEIVAGDRDWAETPLDFFLGEVAFLGSSAPPWGNYNVPSVGPVTLGPDFAGGSLVSPDGQTFKPFDFFGGDSYNFAPVNFQRQPNKRWMLTFQGEQHAFSNTLLGDVNVFAEAQYINRESNAALAETPLAPLIFFGFSDASYSADNFYNPWNEEIFDWRRRMVEGGPREDFTMIETKRLVLGLNGELGNWSWEAFYQFGDATSEDHFSNLYNLNRVANAVGPSQRDPVTGDFIINEATGNPVCVNDPENCVPLDVFGENSITPEMLDYIRFTSNESRGADHEIWGLDVSNSNIAELPAGPLGLAFGFQYREESGFDTPDSQIAALANSNAVTGTPRNPTSGSYDVTEAYFELAIPVLSGLPLVQSLDVDLAHRYSDYNTFGTTNNSKIGARWRLNDDIMLRGSGSEAFRAPQISSLFGGAGTSFPQIADPCSSNPTQFCIDDGVPPGGYTPPSQQIPTRVGGNPGIQPETADTVTFGLVYTPSWLDGASLTLDWYDVELEDTISSLGGEFILQQCAESGLFCDQIQRFDAASGTQGAVRILDNRLTNVGAVDTSGGDIGITYRGLDTGFGMFDFRLESSYIDKYDKEVAGGTVISHAGRFIDNQDGWFGRWKANGYITWSWNDWRVNYQVRWIKEAEEEFSDLGLGGTFRRDVDDRVYHDIQIAYAIPDVGVKFQLGVDNLLDKDPPLSLHAFNDNTDVRTFDTAGRYIYAKLRYTMEN